MSYRLTAFACLVCDSVLEDVGISETRRVQGLGANQRTKLLETLSAD